MEDSYKWWMAQFVFFDVDDIGVLGGVYHGSLYLLAKDKQHAADRVMLYVSASHPEYSMENYVVNVTNLNDAINEIQKSMEKYDERRLIEHSKDAKREDEE